MNLIYFSSPKGGVGKTTLTANFAYALQRLGHHVVVLDLDSQNSLRLHLGLSIEEKRGVVSNSQYANEWLSQIMETPSGIEILPYGQVTREQKDSFDNKLKQEPDFLSLQLKSLLYRPNTVVLVDLPSGPSVVQDALKRMSAIGMVVMLADGCSAATLSQFEDDDLVMNKQFYIVNQVYIRNRLNRDVTEFYEQKFGAAVLGRVHRDEAISESIAAQKSLFDYAPASAVIQDIENISRSISRILTD